MADLLECGLPAALDAEKLILGSLLGGTLAVEHLLDALGSDDFSLEKHRRIFTAVMELHEAGSAVNRVTVYHRLADKGEAESCDGLGYLIFLEDECVPLNLDSYIRLVKDKATLRRAIFAGRRLIDECLLAQEAPGELLMRAERAIQDLSRGSETGGTLQTPEQVIQAAGGLQEFLEANQHYTATLPWPRAQAIIAGFRPSELIIIAARTGRGKTALATQITLAAAESGNGVAVYSLEMSAREILQRMACTRAGVDSHRLRQRRLTHEERRNLMRALTDIHELPIWIDDRTGCTTAAIRAGLRRIKAKHNIGLLVVDYLQLMESPGRENRVQEVSQISRGLKRMAGELDIPVIALAQLNRGPETEKRRPVLADLRESGSIEQDANVVIFLHWLESDMDSSGPVPVEFIVAKQRSGPSGKVELNFNATYTRFEDPSNNGRRVTEEL